MLETNRAIPSRSLKNTSLPTFQATPGTCMLHYLDQRANFPLDTVLESSDLCKNCAQATYVTTSSMMLFGLLRRKRKKNSKPEAAAAQAPAGEISALTESRTTSTIIPRLRQQINALSDERLRSLQENVHYELTMKDEQAVVSCKLCSRNLILSSKHNKLILSNWTRHVSTCFKAPKSIITLKNTS